MLGSKKLKVSKTADTTSRTTFSRTVYKSFGKFFFNQYFFISRTMNLMIFFVYLFSCVATIWSKTSRCDRRPSINGICTSATVGIYYDQDTEKCKYQGCGNGKKLFESLEDCERICNNRRRNRRIQSSKTNSTSTTSTTTSTPTPTPSSTSAPSSR